MSATATSDILNSSSTSELLVAFRCPAENGINSKNIKLMCSLLPSVEEQEEQEEEG